MSGWTRMTSRSNPNIIYFWNCGTGEALTEEEHRLRYPAAGSSSTSLSSSSSSAGSCSGNYQMAEMVRLLITTLGSQTASVSAPAPPPEGDNSSRDNAVWLCAICGWRNRPGNMKCGGGYPGYGCGRDKDRCQTGCKGPRNHRSRSRSRDRRR